jgi:hypothetical protein
MIPRANWRVGDADRDAAVAALREHFAEGRLSLREFRDRLDAAYAAQTALDLAAVSADLPPRPPPGAGRGGSGASGARRRTYRNRVRLAGVAAVAWILAAVALAIWVPHGGLIAAAALLVGVPVLTMIVLTAGLALLLRWAWRSTAWLEVLPVLAGVPWLGRALWAARVALAGRAAWQAGRRIRRPLASRRASEA